MTSNTVNLCLEEIERLKRARDRAVVQGATHESHLWHAETLLKQLTALLPRLIAATPADGVARDSLADQAREFVNEPRRHPKLPGEEGDGTAPMADTLGAPSSPGHNVTLADEVAAGLHEEPTA